MPVKSDKLYSLASWKDVQEPSNYIYSKYVKNVPGKRMYLYGVSLGGAIAGRYVLNDNDKIPYSACVAYGNPFAPDEAIASFKSKAYGLYDFILGFNLHLKIKP